MAMRRAGRPTSLPPRRKSRTSPRTTRGCEALAKSSGRLFQDKRRPLPFYSTAKGQRGKLKPGGIPADEDGGAFDETVAFHSSAAADPRARLQRECGPEGAAHASVARPCDTACDAG